MKKFGIIAAFLALLIWVLSYLRNGVSVGFESDE